MDVSRLTIEDFSLVAVDKLRYRDTDRQGHVNNAVFSTFFETGRAELLYNDDNPLMNDGCSYVIASIKLDFINEITWPGEIKIGTRVSKVGNSSITLYQALFQQEVCVAVSETVIVQVNNITRRSEPLNGEAVERLRDFHA